MALLQIPIDATASCWRQNTTLDGVVYALGFRWNATDARWYMDVYDAAGTLLLAGVPIVLDWPLTAKFAGRLSGMPPGVFLAIDETGSGLQITQENFGDEIKLLYVEASNA